MQLDEALRLEPGNAEVAALRARLLDRVGAGAGGDRGLSRGAALGARAPDLRNNLAWLLATRAAGDPGAAAEAVGLAEQAVAELGDGDAGALDTLAAAYAAAGRRQDAARTAERALALAEAGGNAALAAQIRERALDTTRARIAPKPA